MANTSNPTQSASGGQAFRFGGCTLDVRRRSLSAPGAEVSLQPRVFDVLHYLVRHRDRVVSKDELLDKLWPGTVVVDNALQRVISLARAALTEVGMADAVRTYSRHGYRFCVDDCIEEDAIRVDTAGDADIAEARSACERCVWDRACDAYARADARGALSPGGAEEWARAAICGGIADTVAPALERAVAACVRADDPRGAARATLLLAHIRINRIEAELARGLLKRAARFLDGQPEAIEHGQVAWMSARLAMMLRDLPNVFEHADRAVRIGRALRNVDVECLGLIYRGHALIGRRDFIAGAEQHEEAAAAIRLGGVSQWAGGFVYCSIIYGARNRCDWKRAAQWTEAFEAWFEKANIPAFPGTCQLHRAEVRIVRGELEAAAEGVRGAADALARVAPYAQGDAFCVLGEIQLLRGDNAGAEASFRQAHALGWDPQPGLARLQLATGQPALALRSLERALDTSDWGLAERRVQILCTLVHAALAAGKPAKAREALAALDADPQMLCNDALNAIAERARAEVAACEHQASAAIARLKVSIRHWRQVGSPLPEAEARLRLAECLIDDDDRVAAGMELHVVETIGEVRLAPELQGRLERLRATLSSPQEPALRAAPPRRKA